MEALHRSPSPRPEGGSSRRRGGFVFLHPLHRAPSSASIECACAGRTTPARATLFLRRPVHPSAPSLPCVLSRATPLLILLQTGSIPPALASRRHPRRPSQSPLERYVPMRIYMHTLIYKRILFIHISPASSSSTGRLQIPNARDNNALCRP